MTADVLNRRRSRLMHRAAPWGCSLREMEVYAPYTPLTVGAPVALPSTTVYEGMTVRLVRAE